MNKFWELYETSAVVSGALALILVGGVVYLTSTGKPVPEILAGFAGLAVGHFFGAGKATAVVKTFKSG